MSSATTTDVIVPSVSSPSPASANDAAATNKSKETSAPAAPTPSKTTESKTTGSNNAEVRVKEQFIVERKPGDDEEERDCDVRDHQKDNHDGRDDSRGNNQHNKRRKKRGQNKKRPRDERQNPADKLCLAVARGDDCGRGEDCRFSHDIKAYLATRPKDIEQIKGGCPLFQQKGSVDDW